MLERYRQHNAEVKAYFKDRPEDLLIMDMETDGWEKLSRFLDKPVPSIEYPKEYITRELNRNSGSY